MNKPIVFISHISEEKELAICLKDYIEKKFLNIIDVFASSHEDSIGLGDDWINIIKTSLQNCNLEIVLCSPLSVSKPWINFEAGGGWIKGIPVIPLCHSGLTPGELPIPLKTLQGGQISQKKDIEKLFKKIAALNKINIPSIEDVEFFNIVEDFEKKIKDSILTKDTLAVFNLLSGHVANLFYSITASITDIGEKENIHLNDINDYKIEFKKLGNLFNITLNMNFDKNLDKVFQFFYHTINKLSDDIKFILTHKSLVLSPDLIDLLNNFLYQVKDTDSWIGYFNIISNNKNEKLEQADKNWIKTFENVPQKLKSNVINYYIDYYNNLIFCQNWINNFLTIVQKISKSNLEFYHM